jgi:hypothetical protein
MVVGHTHWDDTASAEGTLPGPRPRFLFAPDQIAKRRTEWGRIGFESAVAAAWDRFLHFSDGWLTFRHRSGAAEVETAYRDLLEGRGDPLVGYICTLAGEDSDR